MRFLVRPLLTTCTLLFGLMLYWRPTPLLLEMVPVDWAAAYEKDHTPPDHLWGAMEMAKELFRSWASPVPLTEFIDQQTRDQRVRVDNEVWLNWYADNFPGDSTAHKNTAYFRPMDSPLSQLTQEQGYLELRDKSTVSHLHFRILHPTELVGRNIPNDLRYPFRNQAIAVLIVALSLLVLNRFYRGEPDLIELSSAGLGCKVGSAILTTGGAAVALPFFYGYSGSGAFEEAPFIAIGGFVSLIGVITLLMFGLQISILHKIVSGRDLLAHWTFDSQEWRRYAEWEFGEEKSEKKGLVILISVITLGIGLIFWVIAQNEAAAWTLLLLAVLLLLLWLIAWLLPKLKYRRNLKQTGEVYIGTSGIYINGSVHTWNFLGSRIESVDYLSKPFPLLIFVYSYLMVAGRSLYFFRQSVAVRTPVPLGKEAEAQRIAERFSSSHAGLMPEVRKQT